MVKKGDRVRQRQVVAYMDNADLQGQLIPSRAQLGSRPEEIAQARSQVEQCQQALNLLKAGSRPEEIVAARAQVEAARGASQKI